MRKAGEEEGSKERKDWKFVREVFRNDVIDIAIARKKMGCMMEWDVCDEMYVCEESKKGVGRCVRDCVRDCVRETYVGPVLGLCRDKCCCERNTFYIITRF